MGKIDIDEFVCSLMRFTPVATETKYLIQSALKDQGLQYNDGQIAELESKPKWYKCIKEFKSFTVGKLYCTNENGDILADEDAEYRYAIVIDNPYFRTWFRPATEEEIMLEKESNKKIRFSNIDLDEDELRNKVKELLHKNEDLGPDSGFWSKEEVEQLKKDTDEGSKRINELMRKVVFAKEPDIDAMVERFKEGIILSKNLKHDDLMVRAIAYRKGLEDMYKNFKG